MNRRINGAVGVEFHLQKGQAVYQFPAVPELAGKQLITVSYCNANDVPLTPSGMPVFPLASDRLELRIADDKSKTPIHYPVADIEWKQHQLTFNQYMDPEKSELVLTNFDNAELWDETSVYLIFWYGTFTDDIQVINTGILPLEITITGNKSYFSASTFAENKKSMLLMLSFPDFTPSGSEGTDRSCISDKFLTLAGNDEVLFSRIPVYQFYLAQRAGYFYLNTLSMDFDKSYTETLSVENYKPESLFFNLMYL